MTGVGLLDLAVERAGGVPHRDELLLCLLGDEDRHHRRQRDDQHGDTGQQRADRNHHDDHTDQRQHRVEQLSEGLLQGLLHVVHVIGHPAQQLATRLRIEIAQR